MTNRNAEIRRRLHSHTQRLLAMPVDQLRARLLNSERDEVRRVAGYFGITERQA